MVSGLSPVAETDTGTGLPPDPGEPHDALVGLTSVGLVPYSISHEVTFSPLGLTVPLSVADVCVTDDAGSVTTTGVLTSAMLWYRLVPMAVAPLGALTSTG